MKSSVDKFLARINEQVQIIGPMSFERSLVKPDIPTIIVDGGLDHRIKFQEFFCVGDGDSCSNELSDKIDIRLEVEKDFSDLAFALKLLDQHLVNSIMLFGFLGGRRDHEYFNIFESYSFLKKNANKTICFENDIIIFGAGKYELNHQGLFSISTLEINQVSLRGSIKYEFHGELEPYKSHGLSNIGVGPFELECSSPVIVFLSLNVA